MIGRPAAISDCELAWRQGRWDPQLCLRAWQQAKNKPSPHNIYLALKVQHALCGLQAHHLDQTEQQIVEQRIRWHAVTIRLLCAHLQLKQFDRAKALLDSRLTGRINPIRARLLSGFPCALNYLEQQQPERLTGGLRGLAVHAEQLLRDCDHLNPAMLKSIGRRSNSTQRIAVVGNAPCILENNDGAEIDNHDIVVRFNIANPLTKLTKHIGSRTDLWVISPALAGRQSSPPVNVFALSGINPLDGQSRYWRSLHKHGIARLVLFNQQDWYELVAKLHAPPSAGLLMLKSLQRMATNQTVNVFGFTTSVDQSLTLRPGYNYLSKKAGSTRHNWAEETRLIEEMLPVRAA